MKNPRWYENRTWIRRFLSLWGLMCLLCLVCSFRADSDSLSSYQGKIIRQIEFRGQVKTENAAIEIRLNSYKKEAVSRKISEVGSPLDLKTVQEEVKVLWKMNEFDDIQVQVNEVGDGKVDLIFVLQEKPTLRTISYVGNDAIKTEDLDKERPSLKAGTTYHPNLVRDKLEAIRKMYRAQGYTMAEIEARVLPSTDRTVNVTFSIREREKLQVRQIRFTGNEVFSEDTLRNEALTFTFEDYRWSDFADIFRRRAVPSGIYTEDGFYEGSLKQLTAFYWDKGYFSVSVGKPVVTLSPDKRFVYITIPVKEGQQYKVESVDIKFADRATSVFSKEELLKIIGDKPVELKVGDLFSREKVAKAIQEISKIYKEKGYAFSQIAPLLDPSKVNHEKRVIPIGFSIDPGKSVRIGKMIVRGNTKTHEKVIRREFEISEGDLYNQTLIDEGKNGLIMLGYFDKVEVNLMKDENTEEGTVDVLVEVTEKSNGAFNVNLGVSSVQYLTFGANLALTNVLGWGSFLRLYAMLAPFGPYAQNLFSISYEEPRFLDSRVSFGASGYYTIQFFPNATFSKTMGGGRIQLGYAFNKFLRVSGEYKLEQFRISPYMQDLSSTPFSPNLYKQGIGSSLSFSLDYREVDNGYYPTKGFGDRPLGMHYSFGVEISDQYLGSSINYIRLNGAMKLYRHLGGPFTFRFLLAGGFVWSRSPDGVPIFERYYNMPMASFENRGFNPNSMGPRVAIPATDPSSVPEYTSIGANYFVRASAELEFSLLPEKYNNLGIKGAVFLDVGNGYNIENNPNSSLNYCTQGAGVPRVFSPCENYPTFQNLRYSVGFGLRWVNSPLGAPLRFDFGFPLNGIVSKITNNPFQEPVYYFTFGMGASF